MKSVILLFSVALLFWSCKDPTETTSSRGCEDVSGTRTARAAEAASAQPADPILVSTNVPAYSPTYLPDEGLYDPNNKCKDETLEAAPASAKYAFRDKRTGLVYDEDKEFMKGQHVYLILKHSDNYRIKSVEDRSYTLEQAYRNGDYHYYPVLFSDRENASIKLTLFTTISSSPTAPIQMFGAWKSGTTEITTDHPATISGNNNLVKNLNSTDNLLLEMTEKDAPAGTLPAGSGGSHGG